MTFAARAHRGAIHLLEFVMTPASNGGTAIGYQSSRIGAPYGSITPDTSSLFSGRLDAFFWASTAGPFIYQIDVESTPPVGIESVDTIVGGQYYGPLILSGPKRYSFFGQTFSPFTVGVPVSVQLIFR